QVETFAQEKSWKKFVLAFNMSPLEVLRSESTDEFMIIRKQYRKRIFEIHPDRNTNDDAVEQTRRLTLAWEVIKELNDKGLLESDDKS
ncbi:DnaJ domain-containing protein, partial [bacterium AH-315-E10]|nr:DnaJ domain-containing protein [bacterium AH-315-E10]